MSRYEFRLPDIGEGTAEAELVGWHVQLGDRIEEDQPLIDVMTDKATVEVTSPVDGTVIERRGEAGDMMQVGSVVLVLETETEAVRPAAGALPAPPPEDAPSIMASEPSQIPHRVLTTPAVRRRAREAGVDLANVIGSGPRGKVRQPDLEAYMSGQAAPPRPAQPQAEPSPAAPPTELSAPATTETAGSIRSARDDDAFDEVPVIGLRRKIAERMQDTKRRIPHFTYIEEVDLTALEQLRSSLNRKFEGKRPKLTLLPFLLRALAETLPDYPHLNALFDDSAGVVRHYRALHAGIATQTPRGLVVTVIRDVGAKSLWPLAEEIVRLSDLARSGRAASTDLSGSTMTITSLGAMGGVATTPVINSPEVAIVGVNKLMERPVIRSGTVAIAKMMNLSSSFDHRVVDGWDAASFIQKVKALLEEPALLLV